MTYQLSDEDRGALNVAVDEAETCKCHGDDYGSDHIHAAVEAIVAREVAAWQAATGDPTPDHAKATTSDIAASMNELARQRDAAEAKVAAVEALADRADDRADVQMRLVTTTALRSALGEARS